MAKNEKSSERLGTIASKAMRLTSKKNITIAQIRALGGSVNTQRPDRKTKRR